MKGLVGQCRPPPRIFGLELPLVKPTVNQTSLELHGFLLRVGTR